MRRVKVFVVVPPRLLLLDVAGPLEVLRRANQVQNKVRFEVQYIGPSASLLTSIGMMITAIEPMPERLPAQALVVLAGDVEDVMVCGGWTSPGRSRADAVCEDAIVEWLKTVIRPGHQLISICSGALLDAPDFSMDTRAPRTIRATRNLRSWPPKPGFWKTGSMCRTAIVIQAQESRRASI